MPQQAHGLDRVRTGDHPRDQRQQLPQRVLATGTIDADVLLDHVVQPGPFGELKHRRQTRARHEVGIIKDRGDTMADSHPTDALLCV